MVVNRKQLCEWLTDSNLTKNSSHVIVVESSLFGDAYPVYVDCSSNIYETIDRQRGKIRGVYNLSSNLKLQINGDNRFNIFPEEKPSHFHEIENIMNEIKNAKELSSFVYEIINNHLHKNDEEFELQSLKSFLNLSSYYARKLMTGISPYLIAEAIFAVYHKGSNPDTKSSPPKEEDIHLDALSYSYSKLLSARLVPQEYSNEEIESRIVKMKAEQYL